MPHPRNTLLRRIAHHLPPGVRSRLVPTLENHVFPILSHIPGPTIKLVVLYIVLQVMVSQSTSVQKVWAATKRVTPRPVHTAVAAVGETSVGGAAWNATLAIRSGADRVFRPVRDVHDRQRQRGQEAAVVRTEIQRTIENVLGQPTPPSVDEIMKKVEEDTLPPSRTR